MNRDGRALLEADRRAILATLDAHASRGRFCAIRARALYVLAWSSALRLSECLSVHVDDVLEAGSSLRSPRVRSSFELDRARAKGGHGGLIVISRAARAAIGAYLRELLRRGWTTGTLDGAPLPLFLTAKGRHVAGVHVRMPKRLAQRDWRVWQERALIRAPFYRWHDLRHTAITRYASAVKGDAYKVAAFARHGDLRTSLRYTHGSAEEIALAAEEL